jgi:hypothetical protein
MLQDALDKLDRYLLAPCNPSVQDPIQCSKSYLLTTFETNTKQTQIEIKTLVLSQQTEVDAK